MQKDATKRLKSLVYVDEKDFEGEEELCNALVSFIGRWKKKTLAECERQRQKTEEEMASALEVIALWEEAGEGDYEAYDRARDIVAAKLSPVQDLKHLLPLCRIRSAARAVQTDTAGIVRQNSSRI